MEKSLKHSPGKVDSIHIGTREDMSKQLVSTITAQLDGFAGDNHQGVSRVAYEHDSDPAGTVRRNDRQWSAVSVEELDAMTAALELQKPLTAEDLGANLCIAGIPDFSKLPRGSRLKFESGAILMVESYNPPCSDMAEKISSLYSTTNGSAVTPRQFIIASKKQRGVVGVVDVAGEIRQGDEMVLEFYLPPKL